MVHNGALMENLYIFYCLRIPHLHWRRKGFSHLARFYFLYMGRMNVPFTSIFLPVVWGKHNRIITIILVAKIVLRVSVYHLKHFKVSGYRGGRGFTC